MRRWLLVAALPAAVVLAVAIPSGRSQQPPNFGSKPVFKVAVQGSGRGSVTSMPPGIDCRPVCKAKFVDGATIVLTATPRPSSTFAGWSGACIGRSVWCVLPAIADTAVTARFVPRKGGSYEDVGDHFVTNPVLNVTVAFPGSQHVDAPDGVVSSSPKGIRCGPNSTCWASYKTGTRVVLRTSAPAKYRFKGWTGLLLPGTCSRTAATCALTMTTTINVTATFVHGP